MITTLSARARRHAGLLTHLALAVACYFPLVFTARGRLAADTREAIYLDPGRFIHEALSMWNPSRALGTVTHQNIVLVWPMAVYYWLADSLGVPLWLAQRVWTGSLFFLAGAGVLYLARSIRWARWTSSAAWPGVGPAVAAFAYALTPYVLQYVTRSSVLLAPWTALPWLIGLAARSLETRGWRHPALFALVTLSVAVNATALALVLLGPMLWIVWSVWGLREVSVRHALATVGRIAVLGVITSLWWVVALLIEGRYSLPLLSFTETIDQVAATSGATEILRGLGYWVVYVALNGMLDIKSAHLYLENIPVLVVGYAVVVLTVVGIVSMRWRQRTFFAALVVFGVVVGAGAYPTTDRSPIGAFFHDVASSGGIGLALRSTSRAVPLVLLGLACLLGAFVDALTRRMRRTGLTLAVLLILVTVVLSPAVVSRDLVDPNYSGPENIADAWTALIAAADQNSAADGSAAGTRMLEIPGSTFAAYRWGTSYHEPITTGNSKTPTTWREQIPYGSPGSADLLTALDNRIQEGRLDPDALAPVARIMGVGQLVVRNDLAYERTHTVAPDRVWDLVDPAPAGLGAAQGFGPVGVNQPDPAQLQVDTPTPAEPSTTYPELALVPVKNARQLVQVVSVVGTVVLDGSGDGIVDAATAGVIDGTAPILYAATTRTDPKLVKQVLAHGGRIVLTDTNRRRVQRWRTTNNTTGITLRADQNPADDAGQYGGETSLDVFPGHGSDWETVALQTGAQADATKYGDVITFENGRGPAAALDGNPDTAWTVRPPLGGVGDSLTVRYDTPQHTDHLRLLATDDDTLLTSVDLRFDDGPPMHVQLDDSSRAGNGQVITFPDREVSKLQVSIAGTAPKQPGGGGQVGIAELDLGGVQVHQTVRLPVGLTNRLGASSVASPMSIVLTREDGDQTRPDPINFMEEPTIARQFSLPTARSFSLTGTAVPNNTADDGIASADPTAASECRTGIVSVDRTDVPVRVEPRPARAGARNAPDNRTVVACAPLTLSAGVHTVDTTITGGVDVNQLVLGSDAGGTPSLLGADGRPVIPATPAPITTTWNQHSATDLDVHADATTGPSWLVLGQSYSDGWAASAAQGNDPAGPTLINGFANGWYVSTAKPHGASYSVTWGPQRAMDLALLVTLAGILLSLGLVVFGRRWRAVSTVADRAGGLATGAPVLDAPWADRARLPIARVAVVAVVLGLAAAVIIDPLWGVALAALVAISGTWRHGHAALTTTIVGGVALSFTVIVVQRIDHPDDAAYEFIAAQHTAHRIALLALALLVVDLLFIRWREAPAPHDPVTDLRRWRTRLGVSMAGSVDAEPSEPSSPADLAGRTADRTGRRRCFLAGALGALPALALFGWMATAGTWDLFAWHPSADFYDVQAHQLLSGHLAMPQSVLDIEAFISNGKAYMYQGPFPAIARFPIVAFTHAYDGRLAGLMMMLAFVAGAAAVTTITWQVRNLFRAGDAVSRGEMLAIGAFVFACTGGSLLLFQASQVGVYQEGAIWAMVLALWSFSVIVRHLTRPTKWTLGVASILAVCTLFSRASIGFGVLVALGLVFLAEVVAWSRARRDRAVPSFVDSFRPHRTPTLRLVLWALVACVVPVMLYCGLNLAKFGTPVSVPWRDQVFTSVSSERRAFLDANHGTFFGPQFVPTSLVEYLRPDAFELQDEFPFIGYRTDSIGREFGLDGVRFEKFDATGSVPVTYPLLLTLSAVGVVALVATRRRRPSTRAMWAPLAGAAAAASTIFVFGYLAQRYLGDVWPLLVLGACVGFAFTTRALRDVSTRARTVIVALLVVIGLGASWINFSQALWSQRLYASPNDEVATESFYDFRTALGRLPAGASTRVEQGDHVPARGAAGAVFVVGDCDGVYVSDGALVDELSPTNWKPVARTPAVGAYDVDVTFRDAPAGTSDPILVGGTAADPYVLRVDHLGDGNVQFRDDHRPGGGTTPIVHVTPGRTYRLRVAGDTQTKSATAFLDDRRVFLGPYAPDTPPHLGYNDLDASTRPVFRGSLHERPASDALCRRLLARG